MLAQLPVFCSVDTSQSPLLLNLTSLPRFALVSESPPSRALLDLLHQSLDITWDSMCLPGLGIASPFHSRDHYPQSPVSNTENSLLRSTIVNSAPVECLKGTLQETLPTDQGRLNKRNNWVKRDTGQYCRANALQNPHPSLRTKTTDPSLPDAHMTSLTS